MRNLPVAVMQHGEAYAIHADHLGTPRVITDGQGREVWRWDSDPFGATPANEDPDGDGQRYRFNLRFPGQYFDAETGLMQNYFRDYDPATGRYIESDPIGLDGGLNTYAYVSGNPVNSVDPLGLTETGAAVGAGIGCGVGGFFGSLAGGAGGGAGGLVCGPGAVACSPAGAAAGAAAGGAAGCGVGAAVGAAVGDAVSDMCSDSKEECYQKCYATYEAQIEVCKMFPSRTARQQCYANAANLLADCQRNCK